jgi:hypothetical protein
MAFFGNIRASKLIVLSLKFHDETYGGKYASISIDIQAGWQGSLVI